MGGAHLIGAYNHIEHPPTLCFNQLNDLIGQNALAKPLVLHVIDGEALLAVENLAFLKRPTFLKHKNAKDNLTLSARVS